MTDIKKYRINTNTNSDSIIRNILMVGQTGSGKSTLANVLTDTNEFKEYDSIISGTKEFQTKEFEYKGIRYRIIDTVGLGDTNSFSTDTNSSSTEIVLNKLSKVGYYIKEEGLSQILFVIKSTFGEQEIKNYDILQRIVFEEDISNYTTIVRTNFRDFHIPEKCEEGKREIISEGNTKLAEIINNCKFIHVNNPSINIEIHDDDDVEELRLMKKKRNKSRVKLLDHLETCQQIFRPNFLASFHEAVEEFNSIIEKVMLEINNNFVILDILNERFDDFISERKKAINRIKDRGKSINNIRKRLIINSAFNIVGGLIQTLASSTLLSPPVGITLAVIGTLMATRGLDSVDVGKDEDREYASLQADFKDDSEKAKTISELWTALIVSNDRLQNIYHRFDNSVYREKKIDKSKIEIVSESMNKILLEMQIKKDKMKDDTSDKQEKKEEKEEKFNYTKSKSFETFLRPTPIIFYFILRDIVASKSTKSLLNIKAVTDDLRKDMNIWEEQRRSLLEEQFENCKRSKEEIEKFSSVKNKLEFELTVASIDLRDKVNVQYNKSLDPWKDFTLDKPNEFVRKLLNPWEIFEGKSIFYQ